MMKLTYFTTLTSVPSSPYIPLLDCSNGKVDLSNHDQSIRHPSLSSALLYDAVPELTDIINRRIQSAGSLNLQRVHSGFLVTITPEKGADATFGQAPLSTPQSLKKASSNFNPTLSCKESLPRISTARAIPCLRIHQSF